MNILPTPDQLKGVWDSVAHGFATFEAPVPDSALVAGFLVALAAQRLASRRSFARVQVLYHDAFNGELLNANRKAYQARAELDRAKKEIERSRQKERRAKRAAAQATGPSQTPREVLLIGEARHRGDDTTAAAHPLPNGAFRAGRPQDDAV